MCRHLQCSQSLPFRIKCDTSWMSLLSFTWFLQKLENNIPGFLSYICILFETLGSFNVNELHVFFLKLCQLQMILHVHSAVKWRYSYSMANFSSSNNRCYCKIVINCFFMEIDPNSLPFANYWYLFWHSWSCFICFWQFIAIFLSLHVKTLCQDDKVVLYITIVVHTIHQWITLSAECTTSLNIQ